MKTIIEKQSAWFTTPRPRDMKPISQIACMIWLADNNTLQELRQRQDLIEQQLVIARRNNLEDALNDLYVMQSNTDAAVAYQTFDDNMWMAYINN